MVMTLFSFLVVWYLQKIGTGWSGWETVGETQPQYWTPGKTVEPGCLRQWSKSANCKATAKSGQKKIIIKYSHFDVRVKLQLIFIKFID